MSTTAVAVTNRKIVLTTDLLKRIVYLADARFIGKKLKDPSKSLTYCRDNYWVKFPHFHRRMGKAIARELGQTHALRYNQYADWTRFMNELTETEMQVAVNSMRVKIAPPVVVPPPPPNRQQHGTDVHDLGPGGSGGVGPSQPGTTIIPDTQPTGFNNIPKRWLDPTRKTHVVQTDRQRQLQGQLRQALISVSQCRVTKNQEDGDLDMDRLTDIGAGVNLSGLFVRSQAGKRLSVAVQIYADISSSMDCSEKHGELQLQLCASLGTVLEKMGVPTMIVAYNDNPYLVKGWNRKLAQSVIWKMPLGEGGTNMPHTLETGFGDLVTRRETRKVAVIISDGDIGCDQGASMIKLHDSETNSTWDGYPPSTVRLRKMFPTVETCFFGIGYMQVPDGAFDYKLTGLGQNIVEQVSSNVVKVIVGK